MKKSTVAGHPFCTVRTFAGLTQSEFASRIGLSLHAVKSIECGRRPVTRDVADKVSIMFGVDPESVQHRNRIPLNLDGKPYSKTDCGKWFSSEPDESEIKQFMERMHDASNILLRSADSRGWFLPVASALLASLHKLADDFKLTDAAARIAVESGKREVIKTTLGQIRRGECSKTNTDGISAVLGLVPRGENLKTRFWFVLRMAGRDKADSTPVKIEIRRYTPFNHLVDLASVIQTTDSKSQRLLISTTRIERFTFTVGKTTKAVEREITHGIRQGGKLGGMPVTLSALRVVTP